MIAIFCRAERNRKQCKDLQLTSSEKRKTCTITKGSVQGNPVIIQYMRKKVFRDVRMNLNQYTGYVFALTCILMHGSVCIYAAGSAYAALRVRTLH